MVTGIPLIAGIRSDFVRHDESLEDARHREGFFTILSHNDAGQLLGYSLWRVDGGVLETWPQRHWGPCRHDARRAWARACAEGRSRGAIVMIDCTWLTPRLFERWLGVRPDYLGDLWRDDGQ